MTSQVKTPTQRIAGYTIRLLTEADYGAADELWTLAFSSGWARNHGHKELTRTFAAFEGKELHAVVGVVDYKMTFGDKSVDCGGISAVATVPGQRSQKLVNALLTEACREMHDREVPFSALYPFSYPFYEKCGWAATHWQYEIETTTAWLKHASKGGNGKRFRMVPKDRCEELLGVYERWHKKFNLNLNRWEEKLRSMLFWPGRNFDWRLFVHEDGYILMDIHRNPAHPQRLRVHEFAYLNEQAYLDGLALMSQMDTQFERVQWTDVDVEPLLKRGVPYPRPVINRDPQMMTRVVHQKAFEALLPKGLGGVTLRDPLGVTADVHGDVGVGEIVQMVTGFFHEPCKRHPELHRLVADKPAFCVEKY
jgi:predicted acetyltransferase